MSRLQTLYREKIQPELMQKLELTNVMAVPRISKVTLNMGVGEAVADRKALENAMNDLARISGHEGFPIGCKVTLRRERMYEFLDRLINVAIPRIRDFRGFSRRGFDGRGNYNLGVREQIIFPEINYDQVDSLRGLDIAITTTAQDDAGGQALLEAFSFPLRA